MTTPAFAKLCTVYAHPDWLLVVCDHQAPSWIWKAGSPMLKLSRDCGPELVGQIVLAVLARSTQGRVPDSPQIDNTVPNFAGFRSWRALEKETLSLSAQSDGRQITLTPSRRDGKGGFLPLQDRQSTCGLDPSAAGAAVLQSLGHCS